MIRGQEMSHRIDTIDERRRLLDCTQKALCHAAGLAPSTYVRIKKRRVSPTERTLIQLDQALLAIARQREAGGEGRA